MKLKILSPKTVNLSRSNAVKLRLLSLALGRPQGWHYYYDQSEIIDLVKINGRGTVLDAGAGFGIIQFFLASSGYDVTSLDYSIRKFPRYYGLLYRFDYLSNEGFDYHHDYQEFIKYKIALKQRLKKLFRPMESLYYILGIIAQIIVFGFLVVSRLFTLKKRPVIRVIRASFDEIPFEDSSFDNIISVSALEHSDPKNWKKVVQECRRCVKVDGRIIITTSGTSNIEDSWDEPTKSTLFSEKSVNEVFGSSLGTLNELELMQHYDQSWFWRVTLARYYKRMFKKFFGNNKVPYIPFVVVSGKD